jgi:predicted small secreted protein
LFIGLPRESKGCPSREDGSEDDHAPGALATTVRWRTDASGAHRYRGPPEQTQEKNMKAIMAIIVGASFFLAGCNTVEGVGKDVKAAGAKTQEEAAEHKKY